MHFLNKTAIPRHPRRIKGGLFLSEIYELPSNPNLTGLSELLPDIPFVSYDGEPLYLKLLLPLARKADPEARFPLVVFIQGSGWTTPDQFFEIPQLSELSRRGYAVASVTHRSSYDAPAPAFLIDVKAAIRFLRKHAEEYAIDPERVCAWGTSSGGNTALLLGVTMGLDEFDSADHAGFSSDVQAVVDCFGPSDLMGLIEKFGIDWQDPDSLARRMTGQIGDEALKIVRSVSPIEYVKKDLDLPPFLLLHGDADDVVDISQSEMMYDKLVKCGHEARLVRVKGAPHEGSFWSPELLTIIFDFIDEQLKV